MAAGCAMNHELQLDLYAASRDEAFPFHPGRWEEPESVLALDGDWTLVRTPKIMLAIGLAVLAWAAVLATLFTI